MAAYSYTVTANAENTAYLWSGHGLIDAINPDLYFRHGDSVTITNTSGGHVMEIGLDDGSVALTESNGVIHFDFVSQGNFIYRCTTHPEMTGGIYIGEPYTNQGPEDGYGTGLLPTRDTQVTVNQIRTKINEIVTKGGVGGGGGASVTTDTTAPSNPSDGDLWYDTNVLEMYVYIGSPTDAWIQISSTGDNAIYMEASFTATSANMTGGRGWFKFNNDTAVTGTVHSDSSSALDIGSTGTDMSSAAFYTIPEDGFYIFNGLCQPNTTSSNISTDLYINDTLSYILSNLGQVGGENEETMTFAGGSYFTAGTQIKISYWISGGANEEVISARWSIAKISAGGASLGGGGASVTTDTTAPSNPSDGDLWFNENVGSLFVYIDGTGWVESNPGGGGGGGGGASWSTGWVSTDGTNIVANDAELTFSHNLGTTNITVAVWASQNADGTDAVYVTSTDRFNPSSPYFNFGSSLQIVSPDSIKVLLGSEGFLAPSKGASPNVEIKNYGSNSGEYPYINLVVTSGGGGNFEYATLDQNSANHLLEASSRVSSVTDAGIGKSTINLSSAYPTSNYAIVALSNQGSSVVYLRHTNVTATSFTLEHRVDTGVFADANIRVIFGTK